jgi:hypothetical protein
MNHDKKLKNAQEIYARMNAEIISAYWKIGKLLNSRLKNDIKEDDLEQIDYAYDIGIGPKTLHNARAFARQYSKEHVQALCNWKYIVDWFLISHSLWREPGFVFNQLESSMSTEDYYWSCVDRKSALKNKFKGIRTPLSQGENNPEKEESSKNNGKSFEALIEENLMLRDELAHQARVIHLMRLEDDSRGGMVYGYAKDIRHLENTLETIKKLIIKGCTLDDIAEILP